MAENQANRSYAPQSGTPGENPVINEEFKDYSSVKEWKWDFPKPGTSVKGKPRQTQGAEAVPKESAGKGKADDSRLKKGMRLYLTRRWEDALKEFLLVEAEGFTSEQRMELAYYLGLCCTKLERFDEALLYFDQVITIGESPVWIYQCRLIIAYVYITTGRAKMAESELARLQDSG
ncbi:MAG: tetratricopeptide repeat protein, partial [Treponema sp.]|nr:tetratricopeptide repeat protein [Treponema sp.]